MTDIHAASCYIFHPIGKCCTCGAAERLANELEDMTENHNGAHESWKRMHEMCMKAEGDCRALQARLDEAVRQKNFAYGERNALVSALSKLFPSSLERHPDEDTTRENDWRWIVFVNLPTGQATWHIHDLELVNFGHLPRNTGAKWDGHNTDEKYTRLLKLETKP